MNPVEQAVENLRRAHKERERATGREPRRFATKMLALRVEAFLSVYDAAVYTASLSEDVDINNVLYRK